MPSVEVGGVELFYEERGSGETVLFVHGIPTDYRAWAYQVGPFSGRFKTVTLSRRYAFPNKREGDLSDSTVPNNAVDLFGFIGKLGIAPVHLVAHSYGGFIAALLASEHPDAVRSLVLVEPAVSSMLVSDPQSRSQLISLLFRSPSVALSAKRFQRGSLQPSFRALEKGDYAEAARLNVNGLQESPNGFDRLPQEVREMMTTNGRTVGELRTEFPKFMPEDASRMVCRTLVMNGDRSPLWLRRIGEKLWRSIPGAKRTVVTGARHFPHLENHHEFNTKVMTFLGGGK